MYGLYFHTYRRMLYISIYVCFFVTHDMHLSFYLLHNLLCIAARHFDGRTITLPIKYIFNVLTFDSGD